MKRDPRYHDKGKIKIKHVAMYVCEMCLDGYGEECHVPGCIHCFQAVPARLDPLMYEVLGEFEVDNERGEVE